MKLSTFLALIIWVILAPFAVSADPQGRPEYLQSFDPAKGFKPAQTDLTEIFLQLAGSLEAYGSPEPYLRHVAAEHKRIEGLYRQKFGKEPRSFRPTFLTNEYLEGFSANWKVLSPMLGLDPYSKEVGHMMRDAIKGTRGNGTILVGIFNQHQTRVFDAMAGKGKKSADFEVLRAELVARLELNNTGVDETGFAIAHRDAVTFALGIHGITMKLYKRLDAGLKPTEAAPIKTAFTGIFMDVGGVAQSELQAGLSEWGLGKLSAAATN
jgi:hypothetical protein